VKNELARRYKFVVGFVGMVVIFLSCTTDPGKIGLGLLPVGDLVNVRRIIEKESIKAYTETDGNQRSDEPAYSLLGTFNDPIFGKTTADFAFQMRLNSFPDHSKDAQPDSLVLYLLYKEVYGDTVTPQKLKVYELGTDLVLDNKYYQDTNLKSFITGDVLGERSYVPRFKLDSLSTTYGSTKALPKDTVTHEIAIKLNNSLLQKLWAADSLTMSDNDKFLKYFKGLYLEAGDLNQGGGIMKIYTTTSGYQLLLIMHYHNADTDSLTYIYGMNANSARVSRFVHDYSKTKFAANLDKEDNLDSLIYLQTTGGLRTKILIPDLGTWSDSTNFAINQAQLIFQIDTTLTDVTKLLPPSQLVLTALDKDGNEYLPADVAFSSAYYGGYYNSIDKTYRFNIVKHIQQVIAKKKDNYGFHLSTAFRSDTFRRTVLKGASSKTGIRLEITYSKIK
jgi:hypothetical protein